MNSPLNTRPAVLAHKRFLADRASFEGLDLAARFARIEHTNMWGAASVSGLGSVPEATATLLGELSSLVRQLEVRSLVDAPCGDAGWIAPIAEQVDYTGVDIVPALVAAGTERVTQGEFRGRFMLADLTRDPLPRADLILCRDCLVHLSFANVHRALEQFSASGSAWLLATTFPELDHNENCEDGDWRGLNLELEPFNLPPPVALIDERCEEADGGWADKSLGLWRLPR